MSQTTAGKTTTDVPPVDVDAARELISTALEEYCTLHQLGDGVDLAVALSQNVKGWTHTTRLREFLEGVTR